MKRAPTPALPPACETVVERLGAEGDGVAVHPETGATLFLPFTLPGERVLATITHKRGDGWAGTAQVLEPSPARAEAPCPHFTACGGCTVQHLDDGAYVAWKTGLLAASLARAGFGDVPLAPMVRTQPGGRRRMDLALRRVPGGVVVGLHAPRSERVIDIGGCAVLAPALSALIPALRALLRTLATPRREGRGVKPSARSSCRACTLRTSSMAPPKDTSSAMPARASSVQSTSSHRVPRTGFTPSRSDAAVEAAALRRRTSSACIGSRTAS
jgi:tRNA/tmRNA/rRNA uracil-C5-methylase (TrmA/RlmC/RlmD family)